MSTIIRGPIPRDYVLERMERAATAAGLAFAPLADGGGLDITASVSFDGKDTEISVSVFEAEALIGRTPAPLDGQDAVRLVPIRLDAYCWRLASCARKVLEAAPPGATGRSGTYVYTAEVAVNPETIWPDE